MSKNYSQGKSSARNAGWDNAGVFHPVRHML